MKALHAACSQLEQTPGAGFAASPFRMCFVNCYLSTSLSCFLSYKTRLGIKVSFLNWEKPRRRRQIRIYPILSYLSYLSCYKLLKVLGLCIVVIVDSFQLFVTPGTAARQACLSFVIFRVCSNSCPLSQLSHATISSSVTLFSSVSQHLFQWAGSLHQVARLLELQSFQCITLG